ncbi:MAG: SH3 domain-containing protein, partial [Anaerolineae bacterium]
MMKRIGLIVLFGLLWTLAACGGTAESTEPTAAPVEVQTVVVVATPTLAETETNDAQPASGDPVSNEETPATESAPAADAPVLDVPTAEPGQPTMTALVDLNVRTGPGTRYPSVGALRAGTSATIIGQSPDGHWWKIECPSGAGSECWSSAGSQYSSAENAGGVAVAAVPPAPTQAATAVSTATPTPTTNASPTATTTTAADNGDVTATYTATPPADNTAPTATATTTPNDPTATYTPTATATDPGVQIADFDNDSLQNPAQSVFFSITGTRDFSYSNAVSYPDGDQDDWVEFEFPNNANSSQNVWITLTCTISGEPGAQLRATLWENQAQTTKIVLCNNGETQLTVDNTKVQQLQIHWGITKEGVYADYT